MSCTSCVDSLSKAQGICYGLASATFYSMMNPLLKLLYRHQDNRVNPFEVLYWKSLFMFVVNFLIVKFAFGAFVMDVPRKYHRIMVLRMTAGFVSIAFMFNAVKFMPVATANCIVMTNPTWVALFSYLTLGESLSYADIASLVLAFLGVVVINDPFNWVADKVDTTSNNVIIDQRTDTLVGALSAVMAALTGAVSMLCMRIMRKDVHYAVPPFWFAFGGVLFAPMLTAATRHIMYPYGVTESSIIKGRDVSRD